MSQPQVSIITACFNARSYVEATVRSVLAQTGPAIEHIVVDGGSTDGTLDLLRPYADRIRLISEPDQGQADALNKGLRLAQGQIIGWLNADDTYQPGAVQAGWEALQRYSWAGLVFADCHFINGQDQVVDRWQTQPTELADLMLDGCTIPHQAAFLRRTLFDRVGEFDAGLRYVMDYDLLLRGLMAFPAKRVAGTWGNLRVWEGTKTAQHPIEFWPEVLRILERLPADRQIGAGLHSEALRRAHFRFGLEAAWTGDHHAARRELVAACRSGAPYGSWVQAAEHTVEFCRRPSYLSVEPAESARLLNLVMQAAQIVPPLASHLQMVSTFLAVQAGDWTTAGQHAGAALRLSSVARRNRGVWAVWAKSTARRAVVRFRVRGVNRVKSEKSPPTPPDHN